MSSFSKERINKIRSYKARPKNCTIKPTVYSMIDNDSGNGREYTMTYLLQKPLFRVYSQQTGWGLNSYNSA